MLNVSQNHGIHGHIEYLALNQFSSLELQKQLHNLIDELPLGIAIQLGVVPTKNEFWKRIEVIVAGNTYLHTYLSLLAYCTWNGSTSPTTYPKFLAT